MSPHATTWRGPPKPPVVTLEPLPADPRFMPLRTPADLRANDEAHQWFACLRTVGDDPPFYTVEAYFRERASLTTEVEASSNGLAAWLVCLCVLGTVAILAAAGMAWILAHG